MAKAVTVTRAALGPTRTSKRTKANSEGIWGRALMFSVEEKFLVAM